MPCPLLVKPSDGDSVCDYLQLEAVTLHGKGPWARACACFSGFGGPQPPIPFGSLEVQDVDFPRVKLKERLKAWWKLPEGHALPDLSHELPTSPDGVVPLSSWSAYYTARELDKTSPVALLLDAALTTAWTLAQWKALPNRQAKPLHILVLGVERELDLWITFLEVVYAANLLCKNITETCISFVGCCVPESWHRRIRSFELPAHVEGDPKSYKATFRWFRGSFHETYKEIRACVGFDPEVIVGPNAGLAAYPTWPPTLHFIATLGRKNNSLMCCFTDYVEESLFLGVELLEAVHAPRDFKDLCRPELLINPFRQPYAMANPGFRLPTMRNGFALLYSYSV